MPQNGSSVPPSGGDDESRAAEWARRLGPMFEQAGVAAPAEAMNSARHVWVGLPIDQLCNQVADHLAGRHVLFRRGEELGTIDEADGKWVPMKAQRFTSWLPSVGGLMPVKGWDKDTGKYKPGAIDLKQSGQILASDALRVKLPVIEKVSAVPLPVFREELDERGNRRLDLLRPGYDPECRTFTLRGHEAFDDAVDIDDAVSWLKCLFQYFDWGDDGRSVGVQLAAMLTVFCRNLLRGKAPLFVWNSNMPGSGKSKLAQLCLQAVFGAVGASGFPQRDEKSIRQEMDACAQEFKPYMWWDDLPEQRIENQDLNRWLTASFWECRVLGTKETFKGALQAVSLMTGTQLTFGTHLERRLLMVDLFSRREAKDRVLPADAVELDDEFFREESNLNQVLGCLWALVREWDALGRPGSAQAAVPSFEGWSRLVPGMVEANGFRSPLLPMEREDVGNTDRFELRELVQALVLQVAHPQGATEVGHRVELGSRDVIRVARLNELFPDVLMTLDQVRSKLLTSKGFEFPKVPVPNAGADDFSDREMEDFEKEDWLAGWSEPRIDSSWSKRLKRNAMSGQEWDVETPGGVEVWAFGDRGRKSAKGVKYPLVRVR